MFHPLFLSIMSFEETAWISLPTCFLFLRRNSQQNVSSVSSLRRTGTTHTLLISTSTGREEHVISWPSTRTARHATGQNQGGIKSSLTFFQDRWTLKKFQNCTKRCLDTVETIGWEKCPVSSLREEEMIMFGHSIQTWDLLWKCTGQYWWWRQQSRKTPKVWKSSCIWCLCCWRVA